jgi:hypothetical protein
LVACATPASSTPDPLDGSASVGERDLSVLVPPDFAIVRDLLPTCSDGGAPCSTNNIGACVPGHQGCEGNQSVCVPDVTTQPCYTGRAGTSGVGVCHGGMQSCVGVLGACLGQVVPAVENCLNDLDDDCDGVVNNGCPVQIALGTPHELTPQGGSGGAPIVARCPPGALVTHAQFFFDHMTDHASGVAIFCAQPALMRGANGYTAALAAVAPAPYVTAVGTNPVMLDGELDCGTRPGFSVGYQIGGRYDANAIYGLGLYCANGNFNVDANNQLSVSFVPNGAGDYWRFDTATEYIDTCTAGEVLVGYDGRQSDYLYQISAVCAPFVTTYK